MHANIVSSAEAKISWKVLLENHQMIFLLILRSSQGVVPFPLWPNPVFPGLKLMRKMFSTVLDWALATAKWIIAIVTAFLTRNNRKLTKMAKKRYVKLQKTKISTAKLTMITKVNSIKVWEGTINLRELQKSWRCTLTKSANRLKSTEKNQESGRKIATKFNNSLKKRTGILKFGSYH